MSLIAQLKTYKDTRDHATNFREVEPHERIEILFCE